MTNIERLEPKLQGTERDELLKHPAERWLIEHNRLHSAGCPSFTGGCSLRCVRASESLQNQWVPG